MRIPMVATREARYESRTGMCPDTDSDAKIIYKLDDGNDLCTYEADGVCCMDQLPNKSFEKPFEIAEPGSWEIVLTDTRITFYCPLTLGLFGKNGKLKKGKSSAGHLHYNEILMLRTGYMSPEKPYVSVGCKRYDGTTSFILIFAPKKTLEELVKTLRAKLTECLNKTTGMQEEGAFLDKWNAYFDSDLFDGQDRLAVVPGKKILMVYNSEISPT